MNLKIILDNIEHVINEENCSFPLEISFDFKALKIYPLEHS